MHGIERIAQTKLQIEKNEFGVDHFHGRDQRGHSGDHGQIQSPGGIRIKSPQRIDGLHRVVFREQNTNLFLSHVLASFPKSVGNEQFLMRDAMQAWINTPVDTWMIAAAERHCRNWRGQSLNRTQAIGRGVRLLWRNDEDSQENSASGFPYATSPAARRRRAGAETL